MYNQPWGPVPMSEPVAFDYSSLPSLRDLNLPASQNSSPQRPQIQQQRNTWSGSATTSMSNGDVDYKTDMSHNGMMGGQQQMAPNYYNMPNQYHAQSQPYLVPFVPMASHLDPTQQHIQRGGSYGMAPSNMHTYPQPQQSYYGGYNPNMMGGGPINHGMGVPQQQARPVYDENSGHGVRVVSPHLNTAVAAAANATQQQQQLDDTNNNTAKPKQKRQEDSEYVGALALLGMRKQSVVLDSKLPSPPLSNTQTPQTSPARVPLPVNSTPGSISAAGVKSHPATVMSNGYPDNSQQQPQLLDNHGGGTPAFSGLDGYGNPSLWNTNSYGELDPRQYDYSQQQHAQQHQQAWAQQQQQMQHQQQMNLGASISPAQQQMNQQQQMYPNRYHHQTMSLPMNGGMPQPPPQQKQPKGDAIPSPQRPTPSAKRTNSTTSNEIDMSNLEFDPAAEEQITVGNVTGRRRGVAASHGGGSIFTCDHPGCGKTFRRLYNLKSHMCCHLGERPFVCEECHVTFKRIADLRRHIRCLHSTIRPFMCPTCHVGFARSDVFHHHVEFCRNETQPPVIVKRPGRGGSRVSLGGITSPASISAGMSGIGVNSLPKYAEAYGLGNQQQVQQPQQPYNGQPVSPHQQPQRGGREMEDGAYNGRTSSGGNGSAYASPSQQQQYQQAPPPPQQQQQSQQSQQPKPERMSTRNKRYDFSKLGESDEDDETEEEYRDQGDDDDEYNE
ncbi:hypothetical protein SmJEL517_g03666 [Synchytrium microbalum]|uniref:C2H2-type domain-containing protein n=1 Tax=Synchytrium microbalum TaxID=1806994 RepID=A0A507C256_9FUNG|nr:uncharacterized protein SmJEL517_g03666 [Synchytrium microbalum]TPX33501.1 hypothetical protein SmJEL517_g03666 [Synchytrium microbalum]